MDSVRERRAAEIVRYKRAATVGDCCLVNLIAQWDNAEETHNKSLHWIFTPLRSAKTSEFSYA